MIYIAIWSTFFLIILVLLWKSPKERSWLRIIRRSKKIKIISVITIVAISALSIICINLPHSSKEDIGEIDIYQQYAANKVIDLLQDHIIIMDNECLYKGVSPELAYILPTILRIYNGEVSKNATTPHLEQINDTLKIKFLGYKQFSSRRIHILKKVKKSLGKRYKVTLISQGSSHQLQVIYEAKPWDEEQLASLPVMDAAIKNRIDPALLMSLISHISNFQVNYEKDPKCKGLLALDTGVGLEQIFIGAERLRRALETDVPLEDALIQFYPVHPTRREPTDWQKNPLQKSWVDQVKSDILFYRNNGLKLSIKNILPASSDIDPSIIELKAPPSFENPLLVHRQEPKVKVAKTIQDTSVKNQTEGKEFELPSDIGEDSIFSDITTNDIIDIKDTTDDQLFLTDSIPEENPVEITPKKQNESPKEEKNFPLETDDDALATEAGE